MKMKLSVKKHICISLLWVLTFVFLTIPVPVSADEAPGSITVKMDAVGEVSFRLYKAAEQDGKGGYRLCEPFAESAVDLNDKAAAQTLQAYLTGKKIEPLKVSGTDKDGKAVFERLEEGAYLILADSFSVKDKDGNTIAYTMNPMLLSVPGKEVKTGELLWDVTAQAKYSHEKKDDKPITYEVQKIWKGDTKNERPESITVELKKNNTIVEEVVLNADNNWYYKWEKLDPSCSYTVSEKKVPAGYTVSIEKTDQKGSVIVNTRTITPTPTPTTSKTPGTTAGGSRTTLPQTGQLWWPVGILICMGLICLIIGNRIGRREE